MYKKTFELAAVTLLVFFGSTTLLALETARMELPKELSAQSTRIEARGFGGWNKGTYTIGEWQGEFTRGESRLGIFDPLWVSNKGKSSFTFASKAGGPALQASCRMEKGSVTVSIVTFDPKKMRYHCDFRGGGTLQAASFVMGQPKPENMKERFLAKDLRAGEAVIGNRHIVFRSVHRYEGSAFSSQAPVGYLLQERDTVVGAVELTDWNPTMYLRNDLDAAQTESLLVVALAIAVLRDPADSELEE